MNIENTKAIFDTDTNELMLIRSDRGNCVKYRGMVTWMPMGVGVGPDGMDVDIHFKTILTQPPHIYSKKESDAELKKREEDYENNKQEAAK